MISLFGEHFIKTGIFDRDMGKALNDAYDKRLIGDYGIGFIVTEEEARDMLETAKNFVQRLKSYLKRWMEESGFGTLAFGLLVFSHSDNKRM